MHGEITDEASDVIKPVPHNREEQFITIKDILSSVAIANSSSPDTLTNTMDQALVKLLLKYRCDALTVYCGRSYLPVFRKGHYPTEPESAFFLRNPKVRALFNSRGISYANLMHLQNEPIEEYHTCLKNCGITSSLQIIIGEINSPLALFSYDCFNDMGSHTGEETNDLLFFSYMIYAILVKCDVFQ